jgi:hypothetical protein
MVPLVAKEVIRHQSRSVQPEKVEVHVIHAFSEGSVILVKLLQLRKALARVVQESRAAGNFTEVRFEQPENAEVRSVIPVLQPERSHDSNWTAPVANPLKLVALEAEVGITTLARPAAPLKQF